MMAAPNIQDQEKEKRPELLMNLQTEGIIDNMDGQKIDSSTASLILRMAREHERLQAQRMTAGYDPDEEEAEVEAEAEAATTIQAGFRSYRLRRELDELIAMGMSLTDIVAVLPTFIFQNPEFWNWLHRATARALGSTPRGA